MRPQTISGFSSLARNQPAHALVEGVDLVVTHYGEAETELSVLYGRCAHPGADSAAASPLL
ncbi:hypothetical protein N9K67_00790 [Opitutaceae bacterium]|jgi:hypothetical protein|nr:hypothetical protein [Opitutaceae bacterium]